MKIFMAGHFRWIGKEADGNKVVLNRFKGEFNLPSYATADWLKSNASLRVRAAVLDTETTGLNSSRDQVIEIGIRVFEFNKETGEIVSLCDEYSGLEDPGVPLSPVVTQVTGLTDDDLKGQKIDWFKVDQLIQSVDLVVAHHAGFDRPFVEKQCPSAIKKIWGCSLKQVEWFQKGYTSPKLELLCIYHGFFTDAHRALNDADALMYLLSFPNGEQSTYLFEICKNVKRKTVKLSALHSPFETKDILRARGYRWNTQDRCWQKTIFEDEIREEMQFMEAEIYNGAFKGRKQDISVYDHFSERE